MRALTLAVLLLLGFTSASSAECAWIAWIKTSVPGKPDAWKVMGAPPDEAKCRAFAVALNDLNKALTLPTEKSTEIAICFPDTVDPRGAKGK